MLVVARRGPRIQHLHTPVHRPPQVHTQCQKATHTPVIHREQPRIQRPHTRVLHIQTQVPHTPAQILDILIQVIHTLVLLILVQVTLNIQITNIPILHILLQQFVKAQLHTPVRLTLVRVVNTLLIHTRILRTPVKLIHMPTLDILLLVTPVRDILMPRMVVVVQVFRIQQIPPPELIRLNSTLLRLDTQHSHRLVRILQATSLEVTLQPRPLTKDTEAIHQLEDHTETTNQATHPLRNISAVTLDLVFNYYAVQ